MYTRAKKILASEFMYALDKDEDGAEEYIDGLLEERFGATPPPPEARASQRRDRGRRLRREARSRRPKALVEVYGCPLVAWSLRAFRASAGVEVVVIAAPPGRRRSNGSPVRSPVPGSPAPSSDHRRRGRGDTRAGSVGLGLAEVPRAHTELVAVHDAARPLVTAQLIEDGGRPPGSPPSPTADGVIAATPLTDTVKRGRGSWWMWLRRPEPAAGCGRRRRLRCFAPRRFAEPTTATRRPGGGGRRQRDPDRGGRRPGPGASRLRPRTSRSPHRADLRLAQLLLTERG